MVVEACVSTKRSSSAFQAFQKSVRSARESGVAFNPSPMKGKCERAGSPPFAPSVNPTPKATTATTANEAAPLTTPRLRGVVLRVCGGVLVSEKAGCPIAVKEQHARVGTTPARVG